MAQHEAAGNRRKLVGGWAWGEGGRKRLDRAGYLEGTIAFVSHSFQKSYGQTAMGRGGSFALLAVAVFTAMATHLEEARSYRGSTQGKASEKRRAEARR